MGVARTASHRPRTLELTLAHGSIVAADAQALVLGVFSSVDPAGAAAAVDEALGGAIREFTQRRMFSAQLGRVFVLPCPRGRLRAQFVLFAGLGDFDEFDERAGVFAAENVARTLARSGIERFAMVTFGAGSGVPMAAAFAQQLRGLVTGLKQADGQRQVRRITVCEIDAGRHARLERAAQRLARELSDDELEIVLGRATLGAAPEAPSRRPRTPGSDPAYLLVSLREAGRTALECRGSLLTAGAKAAVLAGVTQVERRDLQRVLAPLETGSAAVGDLERIGSQLARLLLKPSVREGLAAMSHRPLVVVHEREASRVPWEVLRIGDAHPALARGLSRRYESEALTVARWRAAPPGDTTIRALLVANPTGDLPGAAAEADSVRALLAARDVTVDTLAGAGASRARLLAALSEARYDLLHFAGHAFFDPLDPARSGLLCAREEVLRGADLARLTHMPALVFCNACEAARVRRRGAKRGSAAPQGSSLAEAFLAGGVANFLGTHWPVGDGAALEFSARFYREWLAGASLGDAVRAARERLLELGSPDWADYVHYGAPQFRLGFPDQDD